MNIKRSLLTSMVLAAGCLLKAQTGYQVTFVNKQEANGFKPPDRLPSDFRQQAGG